LIEVMLGHKSRATSGMTDSDSWPPHADNATATSAACRILECFIIVCHLSFFSGHILPIRAGA
jgi:hypothetical protein